MHCTFQAFHVSIPENGYAEDKMDLECRYCGAWRTLASVEEFLAQDIEVLKNDNRRAGLIARVVFWNRKR